MVKANLETLKKVLVTLKKYGFELNYKKCQFFRKKEYLGYTLSDQSITFSTRHTEAIANFLQSTNVHETQWFLGLVSYFRKFIEDFAIIAKSLYNLSKKTINFDFTKECVEAFKTLKTKLTSYPVLRLYNPETELHTDASAYGLVPLYLCKNRPQITGHLYYSQTTNKVEVNYQLSFLNSRCWSL